MKRNSKVVQGTNFKSGVKSTSKTKDILTFVVLALGLLLAFGGTLLAMYIPEQGYTFGCIASIGILVMVMSLAIQFSGEL